MLYPLSYGRVVVIISFGSRSLMQRRDRTFLDDRAAQASR